MSKPKIPELPGLGSDVVNEACWKFIDNLPHTIPGPIFNDLKPAIYASLCHALPSYAEQAVREALAALKINERAAFEHWASDDGESPAAVERIGHGYRLAQIQTYWIAWQARASLRAEHRCECCDGTGDVHSLDGEWRGTCKCPIGRALASAPVAGEAQRLDAPAQVGGTRFGKGIHWSTVIHAAQRHHDYMQDPAREAARIAQAKQFQALVAGDAAPQASEAVRDALIELVRLQALKDSKNHCPNPQRSDEWAEYRRLWPGAIANAHAALAAQSKDSPCSPTSSTGASQ